MDRTKTAYGLGSAPRGADTTGDQAPTLAADVSFERLPLDLRARARELLGGAGRLEVGELPIGTRARLLEYITTAVPCLATRVVVEDIPGRGAAYDLPLGSCALEVERGDERCVFPVLVERSARSAIVPSIPDQVPAGFVWIPPGESIVGGTGAGAWPRHRRRIEKGLFLGKTEVTFEAYVDFLREVDDPSYHPVHATGTNYVPILDDELRILSPFAPEYPVTIDGALSGGGGSRR